MLHSASISPSSPAPVRPTCLRRVLLVSNPVFHYRASNYNYFARRFREHGYEFFVRSNRLQRNNPYPLEFDFAEIPLRFGRYRREIDRIRPDVVILFLHLKDFLIWPLVHWLKLRGTPVIYWNKGINLEVKNPQWRNRFFHYIHSRCDALLLYSAQNATDIQPKNRAKIFIAPNALNPTAWPEISETREAIKREFGLPYSKYVLFVGRMRKAKKVEHLIEAFNTIDDPGLGAVLVGDRMDYTLDRLIRSPNIRHLGEVFDPQNERVGKLFKAADVFCIPGDVGLGLNEAFQWGLPVVTEGGLQSPEIHYLTHGVNGFVVPENDIVALREKLLWLLRDDALRARFSVAAKAAIAERGSIEAMFQGFLACVSAVSARSAIDESAVGRVSLTF